METNKEHFVRKAPHRPRESGNALIYVLIAIALFAALSMTLGRTTDTSEVSTLSDERAQILSGQLISYAGQVKSALDQMQFAGTDPEDFLFTQPTDATFETEDPVGPPIVLNIHKVYHPAGGGIVPGSLPDEVIVSSPGSDPAPGWYLGEFNNVDWTPLAAGNTSGDGGAEAAYEDVILVAYQITQQMCAKINKTLTGSETIPVMTDTIPNVFIDDSLHSGTNVELTTDAAEICPDCHNVASLCVEDSDGDYGFYSVVADQ